MNETNPTTQAPQAQAWINDVKRLADTMARACAKVTRARYEPGMSINETTEDHRFAQVAFHAAVDALAQAVPQPTPSQPSEGESVGAQPAMEKSIVNLAVKWYGTGSGKSDVAHDLSCAVRDYLAAPNQEQGQAK